MKKHKNIDYKWIAFLGILLTVISVGLKTNFFSKNAKLDFVLQDIEGKNFDMSTLKNKVILLDFWATWCKPCRKSIPDLVYLEEKYGNRGVQVIGICLDFEKKEAIRELKNEYKVNYPVLRATGRFFDYFGKPQVIPTMLIIKGNKIIRRLEGLKSKSSLEKIIKEIL